MSQFADISSNNGSSFGAGAYASAGHSAIMLKATEKWDYTNPFYTRWVRDAHRHGLAVFHYMFARPEDGSPGAQVEHFWNTVRPHFRRPGDYLVIDLETGDPRGGASWLREADSHLEHISGTRPWCYTFWSYFLEGQVTIRSKNMHIAAWGSSRPGTLRWGLPFGMSLAAWQFTDGRVGPTPHGAAGIIGACDMSLLNPAIQRTLRKHSKHRSTNGS